MSASGSRYGVLPREGGLAKPPTVGRGLQMISPLEGGGPSRDFPLARRRISRGAGPREALEVDSHLGLLAKHQRLGPQADGPWYPGYHWADSSPRARDVHAFDRWRRNGTGPKICQAQAGTRGVVVRGAWPNVPHHTAVTAWASIK